MDSKKEGFKRYGHYVQRNRLHWLETERPKIYKLTKPTGENYGTIFTDKDFEKYKKEGYSIEEIDLDEFISKVKSSVEREGSKKE